MKSPERSFAPLSLPSAINSLVYGQKKQKLLCGRSFKSVVFFLDERNFRFLKWIGPKEESNRLDLLHVQLIHDTKAFDFRKSKANNELLYITYQNLRERKKKLSIKFDSEFEKNLFWQGLLYFIHEAQALAQQVTFLDALASRSICFDTPKLKNEILFIDLKNFLKKRLIFVDDTDITSVFSKLNFKLNKKITKNMLKDVLREFLNHNELLEIFEKYCAAWLKNDEAECFLTNEELKAFFKFEQNQDLKEEDICKMFELYGQNGKMSLIGLKNLLFSKNNQIFNPKKAKKSQVFFFTKVEILI